MKIFVMQFGQANRRSLYSFEKALDDHEETKEVSKRVQLLLKEETAAVQTKLVRKD